jgi:outer membrane receptor for ferrienterochelin and colicins
MQIMKLDNIILILFFLLTANAVKSQNSDANIFGHVTSEGAHVPFVNVYVEGTTIGVLTDETGHYLLVNLPVGEVVIVAKSIGYKEERKTVVTKAETTLELNFDLEPDVQSLQGVVVTGTKTFKRITDSQVIVNVLDSKSLEGLQACDISEGLRFQPGLRVETNCQTCGYSQLRMNGLGGDYSQILINGRPVFSPLIGLYGMEQIPANMVERIEVVRGGGSALYGSSAIGGTVNVITRIPQENSYDFSYSLNDINGKSTENVLTGNATIVTRSRDAGASVFVSRRNRDAYDHNGDGFSELPKIQGNSFGANLFYLPDNNQKLEMNFSSIYEYRYGGQMIDKPAHFAQQSEERIHNIVMGGLDYQINFNDDNTSFIAYLAGQYTDRKHYTGAIPDEKPEYTEHFLNPPYGWTDNTTLQGGIQLNHRIFSMPGGANVLTFGAEYLYDDVFDTIPAYFYEIDQTTRNIGVFAQSDWEIGEKVGLLAGARMDKHNLVDKAIVSPRLSLLYKYNPNTQFRLTWGTGFRAPQAFDSDMHIAFAGGGVSRISLAPGLKEERSNSLSASVNYDKATENYIFGFTIEGFYTSLQDAFFLQPIGEDEFGERFEKQNSDGAVVQGATIELRGNLRQKLQLEAGFTLQSSRFDKAVENIEGLPAKRTFLRTPDDYGYLVFTWMPTDRFNAVLSNVYTGKMELAHFAGAPEQPEDEYVISPTFTEINLRLSYQFPLKRSDFGIEIFGGVKNITNAYQDDFDTGKFRDSDYIYGPALPRSIYAGLRLKSF